MPLRILMISPKVSGIGGTAQHVSKLISKLKQSGHHVDVLSAEALPHLKVRGLANISFTFSSSIKSLIKRIKGVRYDVIHCHNIPAVPPALLAKGRVRILTLHGIYSTQIGIIHGRILGSLSRIAERKLINKVDAVTCVSSKCVEYYSRIFKGRIAHIPNAIDLSDMPSQSIRLYSKQLIFAGRLSIEKGIDVLIEAWKHVKCRDAHLIILGDGPLRELVIKAERELRNLHYLGYKKREECLKYISGSDALILPSREEGLPTVILEAMALRTLIIATEIPGVKDVLDSSSAILISEDPDPMELAETIDNIVNCSNQDRGYYEEIISNAYRKVVNKYNWSSTFKKYVELYYTLLGGS